MILNAHRNTSPRLAKAKLGFITTTTALAAVLVLYSGPKLLLAQEATSASAAANVEPGNLPAAGAGPQHEIQAAIVPPQKVEVNFAQAAEPRASSSDDVDEGPKFKDTPPPGEDLQPPARLPRQPRSARPAVAARAPRPPVPVRPSSNIEERLDRLERMVQSLLAEQKQMRGRADVFGKESNEFEFAYPKQFNELRAEVKREEARAVEVEKRALKEAEKALKLEEKLREKRPQQEGFQKQLQALHQQRDALQREMEKLQRQIERIAREHERMNEQEPSRKF